MNKVYISKTNLRQFWIMIIVIIISFLDDACSNGMDCLTTVRIKCFEYKIVLYILKVCVYIYNAIPTVCNISIHYSIIIHNFLCVNRIIIIKAYYKLYIVTILFTKYIGKVVYVIGISIFRFWPKPSASRGRNTSIWMGISSWKSRRTLSHWIISRLTISTYHCYLTTFATHYMHIAHWVFFY